jgi:hypothetical protein
VQHFFNTISPTGDRLVLQDLGPSLESRNWKQLAEQARREAANECPRLAPRPGHLASWDMGTSGLLACWEVGIDGAADRELVSSSGLLEKIYSKWHIDLGGGPTSGREG